MTPTRGLNLVTALRLPTASCPIVIALVGAGGKTTFMRRLAREVQGQKWSTLFTTTTRLWEHQFLSLPTPHLVSTLDEALALAGRIKRGEALTLARARLAEAVKVQGLPPAWVDTLAEQGALDLIVVEADGSRGKPLKAPGEGEPVVPTRTSLFVSMASWNGVGKPLTSRYVHRVEHFAALTGTRPGATITPQAFVRLLTHPEGGLKGCPPRARVLWCINGVDDEARIADAISLARQVLSHSHGLSTPHPPEVMLAALERATPVLAMVGRVAAIVLAAGAGTRFGGPKQIAIWRGQPLIHHVLDAVAAAQIDEIIVVLGAHAEVVRQAVDAWSARGQGEIPLQVVINSRWAEGQSTSVQSGLRAAGAVSAAIFLLADQPRVSSALLDALIATHRRTLAGIVRPRYNGQPGAPVLFDRALFGELMALRGDTGGRAIVRAHPREVVYVDWADAEAAIDVDSPQDLEALP